MGNEDLDLIERFARDVGLTFGKGTQVKAGTLVDALDEWNKAEGMRLSMAELNEHLDLNGARRERQRLHNGQRERVWVNVHLARHDEASYDA